MRLLQCKLKPIPLEKFLINDSDNVHKLKLTSKQKNKGKRFRNAGATTFKKTGIYCGGALSSFYYCYVFIILTISAAAPDTNKSVNNVLTYRNVSSYEIDRSYNSNNKIQEKINSDINKNETNGKMIRAAENLVNENENNKGEQSEEDELNYYNQTGKYIGSRCETVCDANLQHVICDFSSKTCNCENNYPVIIDLHIGCAKPKKLGEQCFYHQTCMYNDENSLCIQVSHNALCQCADGYHLVSYAKPIKRVFCTQDIAALTSNLPTLLGVTTGIAVLAGLICMVLHLFSKTKYPRHRNFGDASIPPPVMYSSDTGIPLKMQSGRPSSRSSMRSSGSAGSYGNRRSSSAQQQQHQQHQQQQQTGSKGVLVSTSRTGSRRPSLSSIHSTSSSVKSYSMLRFEKELQQKEIRQEMKQRLAKLQHQQYYNQNKPQIVIGDTLIYEHNENVVLPNVSPLTPKSTDELLPPVDEIQEINFKKNGQNTSYIGPCNSLTDSG